MIRNYKNHYKTIKRDLEWNIMPVPLNGDILRFNPQKIRLGSINKVRMNSHLRSYEEDFELWWYTVYRTLYGVGSFPN